ncbi:anthranilate synthase component I family protein [Herbiconiux moechotypicola]|uniref:anthranilate synthase component I family protein n=1 Tax=Herbiconiux moechotypicola TaxID=637393 RepID=UPI00217DAF2A|nr:anthranilate synthase component I family protein [Herbiconiux moechotypicola]MCS5729857.1 anthranilate synthase component I family protein [Herbiconiux moechotypicola]
MPAPLLRRTLSGRHDAAAVFDALYSRSVNAFWLDGGAHASSGMSYLGDSERVLEAVSWEALLDGIGIERGEGGPGILSPYSAASAPRFALGWVGWLGYELGVLGDVPSPGARASVTPVATMMRVDRAVEIDHTTGATTLLALDRTGARSWLDTTTRILASLSASSGRTRSLSDTEATDRAHSIAGGAREVRMRHGFDEYAALVEECREVIRAGEAYQLCLTNAFEVEGGFDPVEVHRRLRASSPTAHGGLVRAGDTALVSASPEQFLTVSPSGVVTTRPVKGTRRRDPDPRRDRELAAELAASDKEQAENLMIVDLMRNDLARVCELGSVGVTRLLEVESLPQVHQLVSTVEGRLREGLGAVDALAACFPAGSMTGAPKLSAMEHLARLEGAPRGVYSGAFGYLSDDGSAEFSMVIRSIVVTPGRATVGAGGGITILSDPVAEVEETRLKAAAPLAALGAEVPPWPAPRIRSPREHGGF